MLYNGRSPQSKNYIIITRGVFRFSSKILAFLNCKFLRREVWTVRLIKKFSVHTLTKVTSVHTEVIKASVRRY